MPRIVGVVHGRRGSSSALIAASQPAGQPFEADLDRPDALPFGGRLAQRLDQGRDRRRGQAAPIEDFEDQADVADPDRRVGNARLGERPVGQPDRPRRRPRARPCPISSTPTCVNSRIAGPDGVS